MSSTRQQPRPRNGALHRPHPHHRPHLHHLRRRRRRRSNRNRRRPDTIIYITRVSCEM